MELGLTKLFGTSGIRGDLSILTPELALRTGAALASHYEEGSTITVAHDSRTSSEMLANAVIAGVLGAGCSVRFLGLVPTPVFAFSIKELSSRAGLIVTGSHNPPDQNGLKCYNQQGMELSPEDEDAIERRIISNDFRRVPWDRTGVLLEWKEAADLYTARLTSRIGKCARPLRIVVDCANGAASEISPRVLRSIGCTVVTANCQMDGAFPGRLPEPSPKNLIETCRLVLESSADLGIAHDGDADRLAVIDEKGRCVSNDTILALFARELLKEHGLGRIMTSVDTSHRIDEICQRLGGSLERTKLGKTHLALAEANKIVLCCEPWKIIDPSWGFWGDGIYAAARLVSWLSQSGTTLSNFVSDIPDYPQERLDFPCPRDSKQDIFARIITQLGSELKGIRDTWSFDGFRANFADGSWLLVRASGTESKIRIYAEAKTRERLEQIVTDSSRIVQEAIRKFSG